MKNVSMLLAAAGLLALTGCSQPSTQKLTYSTPTLQKSTAKPVATTSYRFSDAENQDIANADKLSWRIFYQPSTGADAEWFDAVKRGDLAMVKYLVAQGQDIEAKDTGSLDQTALGWAAFIGYEDIFDFLISQGANIDATDKGDVYNVLKSAVLGKNTNIVKKAHNLLIAKHGKVDLNDQTIESDGETLLMVAASNNRLDNVRYLIAQGANPSLVATTTDTALPAYNQSAYSYACTRNHPQMQALLAEYGVVNHRTGKASCE